ncbi:MAG: folylpolyglutamate synthase/dihydrofolate synthase family protein [Pseudomonadota bacterium]
MSKGYQKRDPAETPDEVIGRLSKRHPPGFDLSLNRVRRLLEALGNPHLDIPPAIHVAGTNGKGSAIAFMRAMLEAAGYSVHVHTSPHLVRYNERFRLGLPHAGSTLVDDRSLVQALHRIERVNADEAITVFEMLTAAAFVLFSSRPADITLLEVGLGGRLDATNVIETPLASVITPISLDHQAYLGDTVEKIAGEKAGIIKYGVPVIAAPQMSDRVYDVIDYAAARAHAQVMRSGQDWTVWSERGRLVYQDEEGLMDLSMPKLPGHYQIINAGTAIAAIKTAGISLSHDEIESGLKSVEWPGRLQKLKEGPLFDLAVPGSEIWLDGGHNPSAGEALASAMADLEERVERPLFLIAGMLNTKDPVGFFEPFAGIVRHVFTVPLRHTPNGVSPEDLAEHVMNAGLSAEPCDSVGDAIDLLSEGWRFERPPRILIGGSLYLVGEVMEDCGMAPV